MLELLTSPEAWISFFTLAAMEIVLGIDNIVFITIVTGRLPLDQQRGARRLGIGIALVSRLALLFALSWIMGLTKVLFTFMDHGVSGRDLVLLLGGLFLIWKATHEIYVNVENPHEEEDHAGKASDKANTLFWIMVQVIILDVVFSLDSVITAVGMVKELPIMVAAMVTAVIVMMVFSGPVGDFVQRHASIRILALSFLVLIGVLLTAESMGKHIPKGYIYFAMAYALAIELVNMRLRGKSHADEPPDEKSEKELAASKAPTDVAEAES